MASEEKKKKKKKGLSSPTPKARPSSARNKLEKRKSSSASRSAFPTQEMSQQTMRKKMNEMEATIKSLTRDNKVLARKIEKMDTVSGKKTKKIDAETDMRLNANKERYWLKQKLDRLQKAIEARLKLLGIDFSNIDDLGEALEAAFAAIQKLAAELAKKEDELSAMNDKLNRSKQAQEDSMKEVDKLNRRVAKAKNANDDLKKQIANRDKQLGDIEKQKDSMSDADKQKQSAIDKLRKELDDLRKAKNKQYDDFVDKKAEMTKKIRDKNNECKQMEEDLDKARKDNDKLDAKNKKLEDELEKLRGINDKTQAKLMEERDKNKELTKELQEMKEELDDARKRNAKLKDKLQEMKDELEKLKALLAQRDVQISKQQEQIEEDEERRKRMEEEINDKDVEIQRLNDENKALKDDLEKLKQLLAARDKELKKQKEANKELEREKKESEDNMQTMLEEQREMNELLKKKMATMDKKMKEQERTISDQDNQLSDLKQALDNERREKEALAAKADAEGKDSNENMDALNEEKKQMKELLDKLKKKVGNRDDEIERLKKALEDAEKRLNDYLNRERDDKQTQTDLSGKWIENAKMQLANLDNMFKENDELRRLATKNDGRLLELADENKVLLDEIDALLRQQAQFRPDSSNHRGEVLAMEAAPNNYYTATSATDKSVRLWQINPSAEKARDQVKPVFRAQMEGVALSLAYTRDGTYLVAGCAYKNGPEGLLIVWNMTKGDGVVEFLFRSRPSVRFGRAHCVRWSDDSRYIFSGDTTGSVWIWDVENQVQLAEVRAHKDVVHDIGVARTALFTCGLDQTISVFDLNRLTMGTKKKKKKIKKDKIHVHQPSVFKAKQLNKNERYPYWVVQPTEDVSVLIAGARKLHSFKFSGFTNSDDQKTNVSDASLAKGARIADSDMDMVQSVQVRKGQVVISRRDLAKAKIFSTSNGSETAKAKFKAPVKRIRFTFDNQHCVVCTQKQDGKSCKPPGMHLWNYKK